jgi:hypothetical protein
MGENPPAKLVTWKKIVFVIMVGIGGASYKSYQSYQLKGYLNSHDIVPLVATIAMIFGIVGFVVWWGNREE